MFLSPKSFLSQQLIFPVFHNILSPSIFLFCIHTTWSMHILLQFTFPFSLSHPPSLTWSCLTATSHLYPRPSLLVILPPCHLATWSPCHPATLSPYHLYHHCAMTLSTKVPYYRPITLSLASHPRPHPRLISSSSLSLSLSRPRLISSSPSTSTSTSTSSCLLSPYTPEYSLSWTLYSSFSGPSSLDLYLDSRVSSVLFLSSPSSLLTLSFPFCTYLHMLSYFGPCAPRLLLSPRTPISGFADISLSLFPLLYLHSLVCAHLLTSTYTLAHVT